MLFHKGPVFAVQGIYFVEFCEVQGNDEEKKLKALFLGK